ncbi:hypothetical protein QOZ80_5AG0405930 [Eleusine coracana subsp. coracana]|nr:hypothetical protein QOZ80_5AG0405930 [Eleusine coracana subsp. coracana]
MTHPFRPSTSVPRGCGGDRCASGRDAWPLHHVRHEGVFCRLCSSCVLLYHPSAYCSACLLLISPDAGGEPRIDPALAPPGPTATCSDCGLSVAHLSCLPGDPDSFLCPPCAAANEGRPFSFMPPAPIGSGGRRVLDERAARVLLVAARLANDSVGRAAAAAREEAERCVAEAAAARKRSREMLDNAFRALEAEAQEDKKPPPAAAQPQPQPQPQPPPPKKKTPKSNKANRDRDKLLKLNAMQQPALAFAAAAAAAAAATSMPLPTPPSSSKEEKKPVKQEPQGSVPNRAPLFGALQS